MHLDVNSMKKYRNIFEEIRTHFTNSEIVLFWIESNQHSTASCLNRMTIFLLSEAWIDYRCDHLCQFAILWFNPQLLRYSCVKYDRDVKELLVQLSSHPTVSCEHWSCSCAWQDVGADADTVGASGATEAKAGSAWADALMLRARMPPLGIRPSQDPQGLRGRRSPGSVAHVCQYSRFSAR